MPASLHRLAIVTLALAAAGVAQAASYHLVDLGSDIRAFQVNKQGDIAGETYAQERARVYRGGRWKALQAPRQQTSAGEAINAGGDVVGYLVEGPYASHAMLWPRGGARVTLPIPDGGDAAYAFGVSDDQVVVGYFSLAGVDTNHCFRWTAAHGAVDLGLMAQGRECLAFVINRSGVIVGNAPVTYKGNPRAFRYENGEFRNLGTLPGRDYSAAYAVNNQGHVVGTSGYGRFGGDDHAYLWSGGEMKDIGASSEFADTVARSINDHGDIVGWGFSTADFHYHALRFADGQVIALETEVDDIADWQLNYASSVSEAGMIVGWGERSDGEHAFALVPQAAR
jgi:probable HAF family extracellular repeat protein